MTNATQNLEAVAGVQPVDVASFQPSFASASTLTFAGMVITMFANLASAVVLARILGPSGSGVVTIALVTPTIAIQLINLGLPEAVAFHLARETLPSGSVIGGGIVLGFLLGVFATGLTALALSMFGEVLAAGVPRSYAMTAVLGIPGGILTATLIGAQLGRSRFFAYNAMRVTQGVTIAGATIIAVIVVGGGPSVALAGYVVAQMLVAGCVLAWTLRTTAGIQFRVDAGFVRRAIPYGAKVNFTNLIALLTYRVDVVIVAVFLTPSAVGLYSVAFLTAERLWMISAVASVVLFPRTAAASKHGEVDAEFTGLVLRVVLATTIFAAILLVLVAPLAVPWLFSDRFADSVLPLRILLVGIVSFAGVRILATDNAARGDPGLNSMLAGLALVVNVALNLLLIPRLGIKGAALASSASYSLLFALWLAVLRYRDGVRLRDLLAPRRSDVTAAREILARIWRRPWKGRAV